MAIGRGALTDHRSVTGKEAWRAEHTSVEKGGDELWVGEKFQSNPEIAGSPRNSFRAGLVLDPRR